MRRLLLIVGLALLLLGGAFGLLAAGARLAWDEVPPPDAGRSSAAIAEQEA